MTLRAFVLTSICTLVPIGLAQQSGGEFPLYRYWLNSEDSLVPDTTDDYLKVTNHSEIPIVVESVSNEAKRLGLTAQRIKNRVEIRLLQASLNPVDSESDSDFRYLYVRVSVARSTYSVDLQFNRRVYFDADGNFYIAAGSVWDTGGFGSHNGDASQITNQLDSFLDDFLQAYLSANLR